MAIRATRGVADHHHPVPEHAKTDDPRLAVVFADVFGLKIRRLEYDRCVLKVQLPLCEGYGAFLRVIGDCHLVIVFTSTSLCKSDCRALYVKGPTITSIKRFN